MRRINIRYNNKIDTKSFAEKKDFIKYLSSSNFFIVKGNQIFHAVYKIADDVWNLNVGKSVEFFGYKFAIQSKARVGNQFVL